jgi:hypothetical protein
MFRLAPGAPKPSKGSIRWRLTTPQGGPSKATTEWLKVLRELVGIYALLHSCGLL